jgi:hypothetical protein
MFLKKSVNVVCIVGIILTWTLIGLAKIARYDANYGFAIWALVISLLITLFLFTIFILGREMPITTRCLVTLYLIISSPYSIIVFIYLYGEIVGNYFSINS